MNIFRVILDLLLSVRTAIWLILLLLFTLLYGSFIMPFREEFQALHMAPLFQWMSENPFGVTWWLFAAIVILSLLTVNTLFCSFESVIKKRSGKGLLLLLSPQVIHVGFLFILLAHLMSSYGSYRDAGFVAKGSVVPLSGGALVRFDEVNAEAGPSGYITDWSADISYIKDGRIIRGDVIRPNSPSFQEGFGIYIKTVRFQPFPVALVEISRDPGALWALIGGILFLIGTVTLLMLKIRREDA